MSLPTNPSLKRVLAAGATMLAMSALAGCADDSTASDGSTSDSSSASTKDTTKSDAPERDANGPACTYTAAGEAAKKAELPPDKATVTGTAKATIETSIGTLTATLDGEGAPCTVNSFVSLADQGYFDATTCHRLTTADPLLVLQCGDPSATGRGGPGYSYADELTGSETYGAGTLAMANAGADTNGSQFFIVYGDSQLPPSYTVFGSVDAAAVAAIEKVAADGTDDANGPGDGTPKTPVDITKVTVE